MSGIWKKWFELTLWQAKMLRFQGLLFSRKPNSEPLCLWTASARHVQLQEPDSNRCFIILALRTGYTFPQQARPASSQQLITSYQSDSHHFAQNLPLPDTLIARSGSSDWKTLLFSCEGGETPKLKRGWVLLSEPMGPAGRWGELCWELRTGAPSLINDKDKNWNAWKHNPSA